MAAGLRHHLPTLRRFCVERRGVFVDKIVPTMQNREWIRHRSPIVDVSESVDSLNGSSVSQLYIRMVCRYGKCLCERACVRCVCVRRACVRACV